MIITYRLSDAVFFTMNLMATDYGNGTPEMFSTWHVVESEATVDYRKFYSFKFNGKTYWVPEDDVEKPYVSTEMVHSI